MDKCRDLNFGDMFAKGFTRWGMWIWSPTPPTLAFEEDSLNFEAELPLIMSVPLCVGHGGHEWCLQRAMSIFGGGRHHRTRWVHSKVRYLVWYEIATKSATIYTFPSMEGFIPTFREIAHGWLSRILWCLWSWHWGMALVLVAKLLFHHQRSASCVDIYSINHYHKGWCRSFYA